MLSMWIGMLTERDEASVLDCYHRRAWETNTPAQQWHRYKRYHGGDVLTGGGRRILVDTRDREGADNVDVLHDGRRIPADELEIRAPVEFAGSDEVIVNCTVVDLGRCWESARTLKILGFSVGLLER